MEKQEGRPESRKESHAKEEVKPEPEGSRIGQKMKGTSINWSMKSMMSWKKMLKSL